MKNLNITFWLWAATFLCGCQERFLDKKPDKAQVVPTELPHFQALLDDAWFTVNIGPGIAEVASDNFYQPYENLQSLQAPHIRNAYLWARDVYQGNPLADWNRTYQSVLSANLALDGISKIKPDQTSQALYDQVKGSALFYRAMAFYNLAQVFAAPYDALNAARLPGIPVRLGSDINEIASRGTLKQTYDQILADLAQAITLLPERPSYRTRPSQAAVYALLARIYLSMQEYGKASQSAGSCLDLFPELLDYNTLDATADWPFPPVYPGPVPEIIYYQALVGTEFNFSPFTFVDSALVACYEPDDLRSTCFFKDQGGAQFTFKGNYTGDWTPFGGLATDEVYLIRAECLARSAQTQAAIKDLNTLLKSRFRKGHFKALAAATPQEALSLILTERRKQLINRGLRWTDLRRLNTDPDFKVTLKRRLDNGTIIELPPGDNRYVFPIPDQEIALSGIQQNPR